MFIKKSRTALFSYFLFLVSFFLPSLSFAGEGGSPHRISLQALRGPIVSCGQPGIKCNLCELTHTAVHVIYFMMSFGVYFIVPVLVAWGGLTLMFSAGDPGKISQGKKILTGALVGALIILFSFLIVRVFISALGAADVVPIFEEGFIGCSA